MKLHVILAAVLMVLVQLIFSQPTLEQSLSDNENNNNVKRMSSAWGKRMSSAWGKRMSSAWGKRAESDSDEFYNHILRKLYVQSRLNNNNNDYSRYPTDTESRSPTAATRAHACLALVLEQYLAQRTSSGNGDAAGHESMS